MGIYADSCDMCNDMTKIDNSTGCEAIDGDCKWTPDDTCIPNYMVRCGNFSYAAACDMCNNITGFSNATGREATDGDCKWTSDDTCEQKNPCLPNPCLSPGTCSLVGDDGYEC